MPTNCQPMLLLCLSISTALLAQTHIKIKSIDNELLASVEASRADFGPKLPIVSGYLTTVTPAEGCEFTAYDPNNKFRISLVKKGKCTFSDKALVAQKKGFGAVIVYDPTSPGLVVMGDGGEANIKLESYFVGSAGYRSLKKYISYKAIIITTATAHNVEFYIFIFGCVVGVCLVTLLLALVIKLIVHLHRLWKYKLPVRKIKKLPVKQFDGSNEYCDNCTICLEDFTDRSRVRELPCGHIYHLKCIDPWLIKVHRHCPLCKRDVLKEDPPRENAPDNVDC